MVAAHKHARKSAVSPKGSEAPRQKVKRSPKAVSAEPKVEISSPTMPDIIITLPPIVEATATLSSAPNPDPLLEHVSEKPVFESPAPSVEPVHPPVAAANLMPEHLKNLTRERLVWGVAVAVSWAVTVVALLRLAGVI